MRRLFPSYACVRAGTIMRAYQYTKVQCPSSCNGPPALPGASQTPVHKWKALRPGHNHRQEGSINLDSSSSFRTPRPPRRRARPRSPTRRRVLVRRRRRRVGTVSWRVLARRRRWRQRRTRVRAVQLALLRVRVAVLRGCGRGRSDRCRRRRRSRWGAACQGRAVGRGPVDGAVVRDVVRSGTGGSAGTVRVRMGERGAAPARADDAPPNQRAFEDDDDDGGCASASVCVFDTERRVIMCRKGEVRLEEGTRRGRAGGTSEDVPTAMPMIVPCASPSDFSYPSGKG
jgi:hypothetical protein